MIAVYPFYRQLNPQILELQFPKKHLRNGNSPARIEHHLGTTERKQTILRIKKALSSFRIFISSCVERTSVSWWHPVAFRVDLSVEIRWMDGNGSMQIDRWKGARFFWQYQRAPAAVSEQIFRFLQQNKRNECEQINRGSVASAKF